MYIKTKLTTASLKSIKVILPLSTSYTDLLNTYRIHVILVYNTYTHIHILYIQENSPIAALATLDHPYSGTLLQSPFLLYVNSITRAWLLRER